jgi:hypothetical protein
VVLRTPFLATILHIRIICPYFILITLDFVSICFNLLFLFPVFNSIENLFYCRSLLCTKIDLIFIFTGPSIFILDLFFECPYRPVLWWFGVETLPRLRKVSGWRVLMLQLSRMSTLRFPIRGNVPFPKLFWPELVFLNVKGAQELIPRN